MESGAVAWRTVVAVPRLAVMTMMMLMLVAMMILLSVLVVVVVEADQQLEQVH